MDAMNAENGLICQDHPQTMPSFLMHENCTIGFSMMKLNDCGAGSVASGPSFFLTRMGHRRTSTTVRRNDPCSHRLCCRRCASVIFRPHVCPERVLAYPCNARFSRESSNQIEHWDVLGRCDHDARHVHHCIAAQRTGQHTAAALTTCKFKFCETCKDNGHVE
eukprot:COSAG06_NODE_3300_length_5535_cov_8.894776_2_plen_163_part_00